jgi:putative transposase
VDWRGLTTINPEVAGRVSRAEEWPWSSARPHLAGEDDELATVAPLRALIPDFAALLAAPGDPATTARIERAPTIGRPLGRRNGSQRSSAGSAAPLHPANPVQSREHERTPGENRRCGEKSSKLSP